MRDSVADLDRCFGIIEKQKTIPQASCKGDENSSLKFLFSHEKQTLLSSGPLFPSQVIGIRILRKELHQRLEEQILEFSTFEMAKMRQAINGFDVVNHKRERQFKSNLVPSSFLSDVLRLCKNVRTSALQKQFPEVTAKTFMISKAGNNIEMP